MTLKVTGNRVFLQYFGSSPAHTPTSLLLSFPPPLPPSAPLEHLAFEAFIGALIKHSGFRGKALSGHPGEGSLL